MTQNEAPRTPIWRRRPIGVALVTSVCVVAFASLGMFAHDTAASAQADSAFCGTCHALDGANELLAASGHEDLNCVDCHEPAPGERGQRVLAGLVGAHLAGGEGSTARACEACHLEAPDGPATAIADRAVHQVHLGSDRAELAALSCASCHEPNVHDFTPTDEGCVAAGCHQDQTIDLGGMAHAELACGDCHEGDEPFPDTSPDSASTLLRPDAEQCLGCHEMREITPVPEHDPHEGACSACHLPHEHTSAEDAARTCATVGCHDRLADLSPTHQGLDAGVAADCVSCHAAHDVAVEGDDCRSCHLDIFTTAQSPRERRPALASPFLHVAAARPPLAVSFAARPVAGPKDAPPVARPDRGPHDTVDPAVASPDDEDRFRHRDHRTVECTDCHQGADGTAHGRLTVMTAADCRSCHHRSPVADDCTRCHAGVPSAGRLHSREIEVDLTVWDAPRNRRFVFDHQDHETEACASCHTEDLTLLSSGTDCASCHTEHHEPTTNCAACHAVAPPDAHPIEVHIGCTGAGCHTDPPIGPEPRTRSLCLGCHQELTDHRPGRDCVECHRLPSPATPWISRGGAP